jgi:hypothetical protein
MLFSQFKTETAATILDFLWRHWRRLGVAGARSSAKSTVVQDPEALLLLSTSICRYESRLFDEVMDWIIANANFINFPKLKSIHKRTGLGDACVLSAVVKTVSRHNKRLKWKFSVPETGIAEGPLFLSFPGETEVAHFGAKDPVFLEAGFTRGKFISRGLSGQFNPAEPACSMLRLRSLMGISARVEIILFLICNGQSHPSQIARDTGFSQKNVQDALVDMTASGLIEAVPIDGKRIGYRPCSDDLFALLPVALREFGLFSLPSWISCYKALEMLWAELLPLEIGQLPLLLATRLRELKETLTPLIVSSKIGFYFSASAEYKGEQAIETFYRDIRRFLYKIQGF